MNTFTTKPKRKLLSGEWKDFIKDKTIEISAHAKDHLSVGQRKAFDERELMDPLLKETARLVIEQDNGRFSAYYRKKDGFRKIVIDNIDKKLIIVSFMNVYELPKLNL